MLARDNGCIFGTTPPSMRYHTSMEIKHRKSITSTSDWARDYVSAGGALPMAFLADEQTQGRGTRSKTWDSPVGWTYLSIAFPPPPVEATALSLKVAHVVCTVLREKYTDGFDGSRSEFWVKPPNDVYRGEKKVVGVLLEQNKDALVIGIGIDYPPEYVVEAVVDAVSRCCAHWMEIAGQARNDTQARSSTQARNEKKSSSGCQNARPDAVATS